MQYDIGLKLFFLFPFTQWTHIYKREIYYHDVLPQPNKFCSQGSLPLNASLSRKSFFCPKGLLSAIQLQKVMMTTSKNQDSKGEIHEFQVKSLLQRQGQTNVQQAHAVIFSFTNY